MSIAEIGTAFLLGLLTPLGAACVLPLVPAFLVYITSQVSPEQSKKTFVLIGFLVTAGITLFMLLLGLVFTLILKQSLTGVISVISPFAFGILLVIGVLLVIDFDFNRIIPKAKTPVVRNPLISAFSFGFFFGAIVVPCNPGFIIALLVTATVSVSSFVNSMLSFLFFGMGIGAPILLFSVLPSKAVSAAINFMTKYLRIIKLVIGVFMFLVALYYLVVVFAVFTPDGPVGKILSFLFSWVGLFFPSIGG